MNQQRNINHNTPHMPVQSSHMKSAGYDAENGDLHVTFNGGQRYVYHGVPEDVHQAFTMASSKGSFLKNNIKGNYEFTKL